MFNRQALKINLDDFPPETRTPEEQFEDWGGEPEDFGAEFEAEMRAYEAEVTAEKAAYVEWCEVEGLIPYWDEEMRLRYESGGRPTEFQAYQNWVKAGKPPFFIS